MIEIWIYDQGDSCVCVYIYICLFINTFTCTNLKDIQVFLFQKQNISFFTLVERRLTFLGN